MGQKVHPKAFRLGPLFSWTTRWFADDSRYAEILLEDVDLRKFLFAKLKNAGLEDITIERSINTLKLILRVSRPGIVIGRGGSGLEELKGMIERFLLEHRTVRKRMPQVKQAIETGKYKVDISVEPIKEPNLSAQLVATTISDQLIRRFPPKRACNQALERVMGAGAKGIRIALSGRINGAEIARREKYTAGSVPLSTIREEIDFASVPALTKSGYVGVKVWICKK